MQVFSLSADQIDDFWPAVEPLLQVFEKHCQEMSSAQIREAAKASRQQIFGLGDEDNVYGVAVTEIQETVRGKVCLIVVGCGMAGKGWLVLLDRIHEWAKEIGCIAVRIIGRKGWSRYDRRFRQTGVVMESCL